MRALPPQEAGFRYRLHWVTMTPQARGPEWRETESTRWPPNKLSRAARYSESLELNWAIRAPVSSIRVNKQCSIDHWQAEREFSLALYSVWKSSILIIIIIITLCIQSIYSFADNPLVTKVNVEPWVLLLLGCAPDFPDVSKDLIAVWGYNCRYYEIRLAAPIGLCSSEV